MEKFRYWPKSGRNEITFSSRNCHYLPSKRTNASHFFLNLAVTPYGAIELIIHRFQKFLRRLHILPGSSRMPVFLPRMSIIDLWDIFSYTYNSESSCSWLWILLQYHSNITWHSNIFFKYYASSTSFSPFQNIS